MARSDGRDLGFLPAALQNTAKRVGSELMEVMWPIEDAQAAIEALAQAQRVILGLDIRSDGEPGLATDIPWSDYHPNSSGASIEDARSEALDGLHRPDLAPLVAEGYSWMLITWESEFPRED